MPCCNVFFEFIPQAPAASRPSVVVVPSPGIRIAQWSETISCVVMHQVSRVVWDRAGRGRVIRRRDVRRDVVEGFILGVSGVRKALRWLDGLWSV